MKDKELLKKDIEIYFDSNEIIFNTFINLYPDLDIFYYLKGQYFYKLKEYKKAIENFENCNEYKDKYILGMSYFYLGNYEKTIENLNSFIEEEKIKSLLLSDKKLLDEAIKMYPNEEIYYYLKGKYYYNLKDYSNAILYFNKAIQNKSDEFDKNEDSYFCDDYNNYEDVFYDSDLREYYYKRGLCHFHIKNYKLAIEDFTSSINLLQKYINSKEFYEEAEFYDKCDDPDYNNFSEVIYNDLKEYYYNRCLCYLYTNNYMKFIEDFKKISPEKMELLGLFRQEFLEKIIKIYPEGEEIIYLLRGEYYYSIKDYKNTIFYFNKISKKSKELTYTIGLSYFYIDNYEKSVKILSEVIEEYEIEKEFEWFKDIKELEGKFSKVKDLFSSNIIALNKAVEISSAKTIFYFLRGKYYYNLKEYNKANLDFFQFFNSNKGKNYDKEYLNECLKYIGECNFYIGNIENSIKALDRFIYQEDTKKFFISNKKLLDKAIEMYSDEDIYYFLRGKYYYNLKDYSNSILDFNKVKNIHREIKNEYYKSRGKSYFYINNYKKAIEDFNYIVNEVEIENFLLSNKKLLDEAIEMYSDKDIYYFLRGKYYYNLKDYSNSIFDFIKSIKCYTSKIKSLKENKNFIEFYNYYTKEKFEEQFLKIKTEIVDICHHIAKNYLKFSNYKKAINYFISICMFQENIHIDEEDKKFSNKSIFYKSNIARGLYFLGHYKKSIDIFDELLSINPKRTIFLYYKAMAFYFLNNIEESLLAINEALSLNPNKATYHGVKGKILLSCQKYEEAIESFNKAIELDSKNTFYYLDKAEIYFTLGKYKEALLEYEKASKTNSKVKKYKNLFLENFNSRFNLLFYYVNKANLYYEFKDYNNAIYNLTKAIELDSKKIDYYIERSKIYLKQGLYNRALTDYNKMIELEPNNVSYYKRRGDIYLKQGLYNRALTDCNKMIELEPNNVSYLKKIKSIYLILKDSNKALTNYNKMIELEPNNVSYYKKRGDIYLKLKDYNNALVNYNDVIKLEPNNISYYKKRGDIYLKLKDYSNALVNYNDVIKLEPNNISYYKKRGDIYFELKNYDKALIDYNNITKLKPQKTRYYKKRGDTYFNLKHYYNALNDYNKTIELEPNNLGYYKKRGDTYFELRDYKKALLDYNKVIKANKIKFKYADIFYKRGKIFYYLKRFNEAILDFSRAIELEPQKTKYYEKRAAVYYELKKYDKIVSDYTSLLKLEPQNIVYYAKRAKALVLEKGKSIRNEYKIISKESYDKDEESVQTFYDEDNNIIMNVYSYDYYEKEKELLIPYEPYNNTKYLNYDKAIKDYKAILALNSSNINYFFKAIILYLKLVYIGKNEIQDEIDSDAKKYLNSIIFYCEKVEKLELNFNQNNYHTRIFFQVRGEAFYCLKEYKKAIENYNKAINLGLDNSNFYSKRGESYYHLKEYEKSIEDYSRAISLNPNNAVYYKRRGDSYYNLKEYEKAIEDYSRAISLNPNNATYYNKRGKSYYDLEKYEKAIEDFSRAISLNPNNDTYYNNRGNSYYNLKEYEKAIEDYSRAISLNPNDDTYYKRRGDSYHNLKEYEKAIENYTKVISLNPNKAKELILNGKIKVYSVNELFSNMKKEIES